MTNRPSKQTILNEFLHGYSLKSSSGASVEGAFIAEMTSSAFKISTEQGEWLIKLVERGGEQLEKENTLLSALHAKNAALFTPYCRTISETSYLSLSGEDSEPLNLVAVPFIENFPSFKWTTPTWTISHSAAAGTSLKAFHAASKACLDDGLIDAEAYKNVPIEKIRLSLLAKIEYAGKTQNDLFGHSLPPYQSLRELIINQRFNEVESLPSPVVLHGDFHPGNVLFEGTTVKSIIDFDAEYCFGGNPLFDLSYALIAFSARWRGSPPTETSIADYLGTDHFNCFLGNYQSFKASDEDISLPLKQALAYSCMLFLLWALDQNLTDPQTSHRVLLNASGLLSALAPKDS